MILRMIRTGVQYVNRMPYFISRLFLHIVLLGLLVDSGGTYASHKVFWNSSNPIFLNSNNDHVLEVNLNDQVDFYCPHRPTNVDDAYYVIYQVDSKNQYDDCKLEGVPGKQAKEIINCSAPQKGDIYTFYITDFSAIPGNTAFYAGKTYYYITVSNGSIGGLNNRESAHGACLTRSMKVMIKVCCDENTRSEHCSATEFRNCPVPTSSVSRTSPTTPSTTSTTTSSTTTTTPTTTRRTASPKSTTRHPNEIPDAHATPSTTPKGFDATKDKRVSGSSMAQLSRWLWTLYTFLILYLLGWR